MTDRQKTLLISSATKTRQGILQSLTELARQAYFALDDGCDDGQDYIIIPKVHATKMSELLDTFDQLPNPDDNTLLNAPDKAAHWLQASPEDSDREKELEQALRDILPYAENEAGCLAEVEHRDGSDCGSQKALQAVERAQRLLNRDS
jgi:hypothetical protein